MKSSFELVSIPLLSGYQWRTGTGKEKALLVQFMQLTYQELFPTLTQFDHLAVTVEQYFASRKTPLWWVEEAVTSHTEETSPIACLWMGNAIDQVNGDRYSHIFLLYVKPEHRRKGIGTALMKKAQDWARQRGDRKIGLNVFECNQPALNLYHNLGFETRSLLMIKPLDRDQE